MKAVKHFKKALQIDPDHKGARQELHKIESGVKKKGLKKLISLDFFGKKKK